MLILIGLLLSLGWLALGLHYLYTFVGFESLAILPPYEVALIAVGLVGPVAIVWCVIAMLRGPGRAKRLEKRLDALGEQIALLRQAAGGEGPEMALAVEAKDAKPKAPAAANGGAGKPAKVEPTIAAAPAATPSAESSKAATSPPPSASPEPAPATSDKKPEPTSETGASTPESRSSQAAKPTPRPSPLTDGLPPFKAGKDEPKDGELIYDILRRSVRDHLNDTAMDIAAVLSAREAYSEALTKLRQGGRGAFFQLVAKDLTDGGDSARSRLDRLNAWPMLDSYSEDYRLLLESAGGKTTKLGALIEKSELGQLGAAVSGFVAKSKDKDQSKDKEPAPDSIADKVEKAQGKSA